MSYQSMCRKAGLKAPDSFWNAKIKEIEKNYNGAGPDSFPVAVQIFLKKVLKSDDIESLAKASRRIFTKLLELFVLAFVIHDWEFKCSDGSEEGFHAANKRMLENMLILWAAAYPLSNIFSWHLRFTWWLKAQAAHAACENFGLDAWKD